MLLYFLQFISQIYYNFIFLLHIFLSLKFNATTLFIFFICLLLFRCSCLVTSLKLFFPVFNWIDSGTQKLLKKLLLNCGYLDFIFFIFFIQYPRTRFRIILYSATISISIFVRLFFFSSFNKMPQPTLLDSEKLKNNLFSFRVNKF